MSVLRSRLNMSKSIPWVFGFVLVCTFSGHADDTLETMDYRCEFQGNCNLTSGLRGPSDPTWRAGLERWVVDSKKADIKTNSLQLASTTKTAIPQPKPTNIVEQTEASRPSLKPRHKTAPAAHPKKHAWPRSVSIGKPYQGWLAHGVRMDPTKRFNVRKLKNFATIELVDAIRHAVDAVHKAHPNTPVLPIGNLSRKGGGRFPPHKSHQSGRDADIGYYLSRGHHPIRLRRATRRTIDTPRTWTFVESLLADDKVEYIFMDRRLIRQLRRHAQKVKTIHPSTLEAYFGGRKGHRAIIRHLKGHADHMHVRFHSRGSVAAVKEFIKRNGVNALKPVPRYTTIRRGDSLWRIARRHRTSIKKLRRWNRMGRRVLLRPGKKLVIGWRRPKLP
jgi:hypothetical protein